MDELASKAAGPAPERSWRCVRAQARDAIQRREDRAVAWRSQRTPAITSRCSGVRDRRSGRREDGAGVRQQGSRRDPRATPLRAHSQDHECALERATSSDAEVCSDRDSSLRPQCYARPHSCRACGGGDRHANSRRARRASRRMSAAWPVHMRMALVCGVPAGHVVLQRQSSSRTGTTAFEHVFCRTTRVVG